MCGIVGAISKQGTFSHYVEDMFANMLMMDSIRGADSTGCFGVTANGHIDSIKGNTDGWTFTTSKNFAEFSKRVPANYKIVVGHNRKATSGKITAANAHPFKEKHIIMVHNGMIRNSKSIAETEVDSQAIAHALAEHDAVTALGKLDGAYAIVWFDGSDNTLNMARNKERPLFLVEYAFHWNFASEPGLPLWLNGREGRKPDRIIEVPTEKILTFKLDRLDKGFFEIPYEEFKVWKAPVVQTPTSSTWPRTEPPPFPEKVTDLTARKAKNDGMLPKQGEYIEFRLDDCKLDGDAEVLLGHPIFDKEMDTNIFVRCVLKKNDDSSRYFGLDPKNGQAVYPMDQLWRAKVMYVRNLMGIATIYAHEMEPVIIVNDAQGESFTKKEVEAAIKAGCGRCKGAMTVEDIPRSITRKKNNGSWRLVCPKCLEESLKQAHSKFPEGGTLRARTH
jgi:hypothetical protein